MIGRALALLIRLYQHTFGHFTVGRCRFAPSCSEYAVRALRTHGALRGGVLAVGRVLRCGPWTPGGIDPVPGRHLSRGLHG